MTGIAAGSIATVSKVPGTKLEPDSATGRDHRVDFFRGLSLLFILWNHVFWAVGGPMPFFLQFTPIYWGFSSSTEAFVFLSGYVYGLVYTGVAERYGRFAVWVKSALRAWHLYIANLVAMMLSLGFVSWWLTRVGGAREDIRARLWLDAFVAPDVTVFWELIGLYRIPWAFDVLALYIVLLLMGPAFVLLSRRSIRLVLFVGAAVYVAGQVGLSIPAAHSDLDTWYFNPFAWQLLFLIGIVLGGHGLSISRRSILVAGAGVMLLAAAGWVWWFPRLAWRMPAVFGPIQGAIEQEVFWGDVTNLEPVRLAHFLVLAFFVAAVTRRDSPWWTGASLRPVAVVGGHSLEVFCFGIVFTYAAALVVPWMGGGWQLTAAAGLVGCALSVLFAYLLSARRRMLALLSGRGRDHEVVTR